jgi:hypothetical protein
MDCGEKRKEGSTILRREVASANASRIAGRRGRKETQSQGVKWLVLTLHGFINEFVREFEAKRLKRRVAWAKSEFKKSSQSQCKQRCDKVRCGTRL